MLREFLAKFKKGKGRLLRARGAYRFVKLLGKGGMGEVWLADKHGSDGFSKLVAIKTIARHRWEDVRILEMFVDEARLVANLVHPNIIQVYQLARTRKELFIVMEHVFGVTLLELLERLQELKKPIPFDVGCYVVTRICAGLHYAHHKHSRDGRHLQIVHRDICPSNIMISFRGIPKLADFGVAKAVTSRVDDEGNIVWGKYAYMAPEAVNRHGTDARSDIYGLGLVMYEMFTGHLAHEVESTQGLTELLGHETETDRDVRRLAPEVPDPLASIIGRAMNPDPEARYQRARDLSEALERFLLTHLLFPDEERISDYLSEIFPRASKHRWW